MTRRALAEERRADARVVLAVLPRLCTTVRSLRVLGRAFASAAARDAGSRVTPLAPGQPVARVPRDGRSRPIFPLSDMVAPAWPVVVATEGGVVAVNGYHKPLISSRRLLDG